MIQSPEARLGLPEEESKTAPSRFPRMSSIPDSGRGEASRGQAQPHRTLYPEDTHSAVFASGGYNLSQALNASPAELHEMNETSALQRILNRDTTDPLFPTGSRHGASANIVREMR